MVPVGTVSVEDISVGLLFPVVIGTGPTVVVFSLDVTVDTIVVDVSISHVVVVIRVVVPGVTG